jgi:hypothetical protein
MLQVNPYTIGIAVLIAFVLAYFIYTYKKETLEAMCGCAECTKESFCPSCSVESFNTSFTNSDSHYKQKNNDTNYIIKQT